MLHNENMSSEKCIKCNKKAAKNSYKCVKCENVVHQKCADEEIPRDSDFVCENCLENNSLNSSVTSENGTIILSEERKTQNEVVISDLMKENDRLLRENELLNKLVSEMTDKNNLLLFKIAILEKNNNTLEKPWQHRNSSKNSDAPTQVPPSTHTANHTTQNHTAPPHDVAKSRRTRRTSTRSTSVSPPVLPSPGTSDNHQEINKVRENNKVLSIVGEVEPTLSTAGAENGLQGLSVLKVRSCSWGCCHFCFG
ncbi:unnamed protein product [Acanthoscelides obtectus]|uniref:Zinc finger PHD-type domain-containing protein n=1 Tax=Acanthoscelides obtectus TaxID=200917 RepID=A0A9P0L1R8_ACAOB|nr:unnamed protein product [Acanthoscelides obtectus]CAK1675346.1 hypothetical protein AOBTE_LOCUS30152 [Acanthoscelides obtectus]